jgi:hypothetical protein
MFVDDETSTVGSIKEPAEVKYVPIGDNVELSCRDHLQPPVQYEWLKSNGTLPIRNEKRGVSISII